VTLETFDISFSFSFPFPKGILGHQEEVGRETRRQIHESPLELVQEESAQAYRGTAREAVPEAARILSIFWCAREL
jgi:hypothetical protein